MSDRSDSPDDRIGYGEIGPGPLVTVTDACDNFKFYCLLNDADEICERYNRGLPEPPLVAEDQLDTSIAVCYTPPYEDN